jgi:hypothetical protein
MREIKLCKSCLKDSGFNPKKFRKALAKRLGEDDEIEISSCLKVCPRSGVTFSVREYNSEDEKTRSLRSFVSSHEEVDRTIEVLIRAL